MDGKSEQPANSVEIAFRDIEQLHKLINAARKGDLQARKQLTDFLDRTRMWASAGDVAQRAIDQWIQTIAPTNCPELVRAIEAKLAQLWFALGGPDGTTLERLLIQRIQVCWLQTHYADVAFAAANRMQGMSDKFIRAACERVETCQRSYLRAIRELAVVRRLQPAIVKARVNAATKDQASENAAASPRAKRNPPDDMSDVELAEVMRIQQGRERPEDYPPSATPDVLSTKLHVSDLMDDGVLVEVD